MVLRLKSNRLLLTFANQTQCRYGIYPYNDIALGVVSNGLRTAQRCVEQIAELTKRVYDLECANESLGEVNGKLRVQLGEAHKVEYKGRVQDLQDLCQKREREVVRLRLERNALENSIEGYKGKVGELTQDNADLKASLREGHVVRTHYTPQPCSHCRDERPIPGAFYRRCECGNGWVQT